MKEEPTYLLEINNVTFKYEGSNKKVLNKINLIVEDGKKVGIIGDNGSGKSTITKLLLAIYHPQIGNVNLFGRNVKWGRHYSNVGYIGDPSYHPGWLGLPTNILVRDVINSYEKLWKNEIKKSAKYKLKKEYELKKELDEFEHKLNEFEHKLKLKKIYDTSISLLSKGERLRLMAFLALAKQPKLLIADEATEGLDGEYREAVISLVQEAGTNPDFGMLWISHRYVEVIELTNIIYKLKDGELEEQTLDINGFQCEHNGFQCELKTDKHDASDNLNNLSQDKIGINEKHILEMLSPLLVDPEVNHFTIEGKRKRR